VLALSGGVEPDERCATQRSAAKGTEVLRSVVEENADVKRTVSRPPPTEERGPTTTLTDVVRVRPPNFVSKHGRTCTGRWIGFIPAQQVGDARSDEWSLAGRWHDSC
jgi:hypothetical protein